MLVNGINIAWQNMNVIILGSPITGITKIEYKEVGDHKANYGAGDLPISYGFGNRTYTASIEMYEDAWQQIYLLAGGSPTLLDPIGNDIIIHFSPTTNSIIDLPFTDTIYDVKFLEDSLSLSQGDTKAMITISLMISSFSRFS